MRSTAPPCIWSTPLWLIVNDFRYRSRRERSRCHVHTMDVVYDFVESKSNELIPSMQKWSHLFHLSRVWAALKTLWKVTFCTEHRPQHSSWWNVWFENVPTCSRPIEAPLGRNSSEVPLFTLSKDAHDGTVRNLFLVSKSFICFQLI